MRSVGIVIAALCLGAAAGGATEISPIYGLQVLGGQNFYSGQRNSLSANFNGVVAPAMKVDDNWAVLPTFNSVYQGTEQVLDVVGGGTLFQSQWDNKLGFKTVYTPDDSPWRLKPNVSVKSEFLQQSKDEQLTKGLYDYLMYGAGFDAEYVYHDPFSIKAGVSYFGTHFYNYTSLESQAATQFQGQSLARELVGDYVLDSQSVLASVSVDGPVSQRLILEGGASVLYQKYPNQHVVAPDGSLTQPLRQDAITTVVGGMRMPAELNSDLRLLGSFDLAASYDTSNQNSFDATQTKYIPYYYNYGELRASPSLKVLVGAPQEPTILNVGLTYWYRRYPYRQTQDPVTGAYNGGTATHMNNWMANASVGYPMAPHFSLLFSFQYGRATSNQTFQAFYKYTYTSSNYLFGFSYDY